MNKQNSQPLDVGSFCGKGVYLEGTLRVEGAIHFNGNIDGKLEVSNILIVGENGQIKAEVTARNLLNKGEIIGNINISHESNLQKNSIVKGDINTAHLIIDDGAHFDGNCKMLSPPLEETPEEKTALPINFGTSTDKPKSKKLKFPLLLLIVLALFSAAIFGIFGGYNKITDSLFKNSEKYTKAGFVSLKSGEINEAIKEFTEAIEFDENSFQAHLGLGNSYSKKGEYDKALFEYKKLVELEPANSFGYSSLGRTYMLNNLENQALEAFNQSLDLNPSDIEAHNGLGSIFYKNKFYDKALLEYQKSLEIKPNQSSIHRNIGLIFSHQGKTDSAEAEFENALKINDQDKVAIKMLGELYVGKKYYDKAIPLLEKYVDMDRTSPMPFQWLGESYLKQGRIEDAFQIYKELKQLDPESIEALFNMGELHLRKKELDEAEKYFSQIVELDKNNNDARGHLGLGKVYEAKNKSEDALIKYIKAIENNPKNGEAHILTGNLLIQKKSTVAAIRHFTEALQMDAKDHRIYFGLCTAYTKRGSFTKALGLCRIALDFEPDNPYTLNRLAWLYAKKGINLDEGIKISLNTLKAKPNTPEFIDTLSELYFVKGDINMAIKTIKKAIELSPGSDYFRQQLQKFNASKL